jgi:signal transduction histidine kinase
MERAPADRRVLEVRTRQREDVACLEICDSGCGLEGAECDRLFDAFYTTKEEGMGMGLSLSKSIAESHGVTIRFQTNGDRPGLTFFVDFPTIGGSVHG